MVYVAHDARCDVDITWRLLRVRVFQDALLRGTRVVVSMVYFRDSRSHMVPPARAQDK